MELKECIEYVKKSCIDTGTIEASHDMILDCATRIYNSQNFKDKPKEIKDNNSDQPRASQKQQDYLYGLGFDKDASKLSIIEAKHLIQELKEKRVK